MRKKFSSIDNTLKSSSSQYLAEESHSFKMLDQSIAFGLTCVNKDCLQLVESEYLKLQVAIDDLGTSIDNTLNRQKETLDLSHQSEIAKCKLEIDNLIKDKHQLEESITSNERACQLEVERDWYKKEALHLDSVVEKMKAREKKLNASLLDREQIKGRLHTLAKSNAAYEKKLKELGVNVSSLLVVDEVDKPSRPELDGL